MYEDNASGLLKELAQKHMMVEINLSSNEGILGIKETSIPSRVTGWRMCLWRSRQTMRA